MDKGFSVKLSALIKQRGLSQKLLAEQAGVTEAAISHYLKGDRFPRASVLTRIATVLGTTSDYFMDNAASEKDEDLYRAKRLIARNVNQMSKEEKLEIVKILIGED